MNVLDYFCALLGITFEELPEVNQQILVGVGSVYIACSSLILVWVIFMMIKGLTHDK